MCSDLHKLSVFIGLSQRVCDLTLADAYCFLTALRKDSLCQVEISFNGGSNLNPKLLCAVLNLLSNSALSQLSLNLWGKNALAIYRQFGRFRVAAML